MPIGCASTCDAQYMHSSLLSSTSTLHVILTHSLLYSSPFSPVCMPSLSSMLLLFCLHTHTSPTLSTSLHLGGLRSSQSQRVLRNQLPPLLFIPLQVATNIGHGMVLVCRRRLLASRNCVGVLSPEDPPKPLCWPTVSVFPSVGGSWHQHMKGPNGINSALSTSTSRAMRQRELGSHTPPCHRRMVITTLFSVFPAALQRRPVLYHTRWLLTVLWLQSSGH